MAKEDNTTMIIVVLVVVAALGYFYMQKKNKAGGAPLYGEQSLDEAVKAQREGMHPGLVYEGIDPTEGTPNKGSLTAWPNFDKIGLPIVGPMEIGGKIGDIDPERMASGVCQCDDRKCCYYAPFHTKRDRKEGGGAPRKCTDIHWGNTPEACEKVFDEYVRENERYNSNLAQRAYYAMHPRAAYKARVLQRARMARILS